MASFYEPLSQEDIKERLDLFKKQYEEQFGQPLAEWLLTDQIAQIQAEKLQAHIRSHFSDFSIPNLNAFMSELQSRRSPGIASILSPTAPGVLVPKAPADVGTQYEGKVEAFKAKQAQKKTKSTKKVQT